MRNLEVMEERGIDAYVPVATWFVLCIAVGSCNNRRITRITRRIGASEKSWIPRQAGRCTDDEKRWSNRSSES
jgi:hypothetical protein